MYKVCDKFKYKFVACAYRYIEIGYIHKFILEYSVIIRPLLEAINNENNARGY